MGESRYRLGKRALQQEETRRRIVQAAADLHAEIGPAATTISAVAERAGVQRLTVYRHFPEEDALIAACSRHAVQQHPPPDPSGFVTIEEPLPRLEAALGALYAYYQEREPGLANVLRDAERLEALKAALAPMRDYVERVVDAVAAGWRIGPGMERPFRAALAHAFEFWTWRSLSAQGLDPASAARLMTRFVGAAAGSESEGF